MAKYISRGKLVVTSDYTETELLAALHVQCRMKISFYSTVDEGREVAFVYIKNKFLYGDDVYLEVSYEEDGKDMKKVSIQEVWAFIQKHLDYHRLEVIYRKDEYSDKFPLFHILDKIRKEMVYGAVFFDYNDGMFTFKTKVDGVDLPVELYFWEDTNTTFVFSKDGPRLLFEPEKIDNVLDLVS